jgi:hypothetical protein
MWRTWQYPAIPVPHAANAYTAYGHKQVDVFYTFNHHRCSRMLTALKISAAVLPAPIIIDAGEAAHEK